MATRRTFLRNTAAVGAGAETGVTRGPCAISCVRNANGSEPNLRMGATGETPELRNETIVLSLACDPFQLAGLSEKLIVSHYENNYGGAVKRLNHEQLCYGMVLYDALCAWCKDNAHT
ncbi:MAG TPA: hypothetical protein VF534_02800 [Paraburkholderia sp.]